MQIWFFISLLGFVAIIPPYFLSIQHIKLEEKYGKEKGKRMGELLGMISGWLFFLFWFGIWLSPQQRFVIPIFQELSIQIPFQGFKLNLVNFFVFLPFIVAGIWFGIKGVVQTSLRVAETHRTEHLVIAGVYSTVRHPQYLGGLLAHIGFSILLSALYSLLATPLVIVIIYIISRKEEIELTKEFGKQYTDYKTKVPMLVPKI